MHSLQKWFFIILGNNQFVIEHNNLLKQYFSVHVVVSLHVIFLLEYYNVNLS